MRKTRCLASLCLALLVALPAVAAQPATQRVSLDVAGLDPDGDSTWPALSADGQLVAFQSAATDLVPGDENGKIDIFLRDRVAGATALISVDTNGVQGNGDSTAPSMSADGRYVAFASRATNLAPPDTNARSDIFLHDRQAGSTIRVTMGLSGVQPNGDSLAPALSADGLWIAFESLASNLVADDTNGVTDVFLYDVQAGAIVRVSVDGLGIEGDDRSYEPAVSADGQLVAFTSWATNLVVDDTNDASDIFLHDHATSTTERVSLRNNGTVQGDDYSTDPSLSADGRYVAFTSVAENLVSIDWNYAADVFVRDRVTGKTTRASAATDGTEGDGDCGASAISADGRYVAFESRAGNLVPGDTRPGTSDLFLHDRLAGVTSLLSATPAGLFGNGDSFGPALSSQGEAATFHSAATDLVAGDGNGKLDAFVRILPLPRRTYLPVALCD